MVCAVPISRLGLSSPAGGIGQQFAQIELAGAAGSDPKGRAKHAPVALDCVRAAAGHFTAEEEVFKGGGYDPATGGSAGIGRQA